MTALWVVLAAGAVLVILPSVLDRWAVGRASPTTLVTLGMVSLTGLLLLPLAVAGCLAQSWAQHRHGGPVWPLPVAVSVAVMMIGRTAWAAHSVRRTTRHLGCLAEAAATGRVEHDALVVPISAPPAFVTGHRVVVSSRLVDELPPEQLAAVLAHETAHLDGRHARLALWAHAIRRGLLNVPPARRAERRVRRELEALADRAAARRIGDPAPVVAALNGLRGRPSHVAAMLFSADDVDYRIGRLQRGERCSAGRDRAVLAGAAVAAAAAMWATCNALHEQWLGVGVAACTVTAAAVWGLLRPLRASD